jgi:hypothetical protein
MGMQIYVNKTLGDIRGRKTLTSLKKLSHDKFCCKDSWLELGVWIFIVTVQILIERVVPEITSIDAIWI